MGKVQLQFGGLAETRNCQGLVVVTLTDPQRIRAISVICDSALKYQIGLRFVGAAHSSRFLPEVLLAMLNENSDIKQYVINIYNLVDGEYKVMVQNTETLCEYPIRLNDAILLSLICKMEMFIDKALFEKQSMPYRSMADRLSIPINTLSTVALKQELKKAVDVEDYRLASQIQEELRKRK